MARYSESCPNSISRISEASLVLAFIAGFSWYGRPLSKVGVLLRVTSKRLQPPQSKLDVVGRHFAFFDESVRENCRGRAVKAVQQTIMHVSESDSQFVNAIAERIGGRTGHLPSQFFQLK